MRHTKSERSQHVFSVAITSLGQALNRMQQTAAGVVRPGQPQQILLTHRKGNSPTGCRTRCKLRRQQVEIERVGPDELRRAIADPKWPNAHEQRCSAMLNHTVNLQTKHQVASSPRYSQSKPLRRPANQSSGYQGHCAMFSAHYGCRQSRVGETANLLAGSNSAHTAFLAAFSGSM
jgi:hypothetical protein